MVQQTQQNNLDPTDVGRKMFTVEGAQGAIMNALARMGIDPFKNQFGMMAVERADELIWLATAYGINDQNIDEFVEQWTRQQFGQSTVPGQAAPNQWNLGRNAVQDYLKEFVGATGEADWRNTYLRSGDVTKDYRNIQAMQGLQHAGDNPGMREAYTTMLDRWYRRNQAQRLANPMQEGYLVDDWLRYMNGGQPPASPPVTPAPVQPAPGDGQVVITDPGYKPPAPGTKPVTPVTPPPQLTTPTRPGITDPGYTPNPKNKQPVALPPYGQPIGQKPGPALPVAKEPGKAYISGVSNANTGPTNDPFPTVPNEQIILGLPAPNTPGAGTYTQGGVQQQGATGGATPSSIPSQPAGTIPQNQTMQQWLAALQGNFNTGYGQGSQGKQAYSMGGVNYDPTKDTFKYVFQPNKSEANRQLKGESNWNRMQRWATEYGTGQANRVAKWGAGLTPDQVWQKSYEQLIAEMKAKGFDPSRSGFTRQA